MNPFKLNPKPTEDLFMSLTQLYPVPYDKMAVDPYTRTRVILMNGTEFEANWFSHQFARHTDDNDVRRQLAFIRRQEQQQQKFLSALKPADETVLEHTIGYEQLAVDLTAWLAQNEADPYVKQALDFALLEDFDHLYRYSDFLDSETGVKAENLVGGYTELMPGRPTIAHHRHPYDSVKRPIKSAQAELQTCLNAAVITAAEQQTMNYYMNVCATYPTDEGRRLYQEIGMIEEQHVTQYESLMDPTLSWAECLLMHQYTECYLYYSCMQTEPDMRVRKLWEMLFEQEVSHLHAAKKLLEETEGKDYQSVVGSGEFPSILCLNSNIDYVRGVLASSVSLTACRESWGPVERMEPDTDFFRYQKRVVPAPDEVLSHTVIRDHIREFGIDYRFETAPNPIESLRNRQEDNTELGRVPEKVLSRA